MKLITDRTEEDVLLGTAKGHYTYADLNRVERAVAELCALCPQLDLYPELTTKTDWGAPGKFSGDSWPTDVQMQRYLENVTALCDLFSIDSQKVPGSADELDWCGANSIEEALHLVYLRATAILNTFKYSGELYAGEVV